MEKVYAVIEEQEETNFDDMISNNLVQFEYDVFQQIKSQVKKKANVLFQICKQLTKGFIANYSHYTKIESGKLENKEFLKKKIQDASIQIRNTNRLTTFGSGHLSQLIPQTSVDESRDLAKYMDSHSIDFKDDQ